MERLKVLMQCMKHDMNIAHLDGETILIKSSKNNLTEKVRLLLSSPFISVNKGTENGITALHIAATMENIHVIELLFIFPQKLMGLVEPIKHMLAEPL